MATGTSKSKPKPKAKPRRRHVVGVLDDKGRARGCWCGFIHYTTPSQVSGGWKCVACKNIYETKERAEECAVNNRKEQLKARGELA